MVVLKILASIAVLFLPLAGLLGSREARWIGEKPGTESSRHVFQALGVEAFQQATPAPEFSLATLDGKPLSLLDLSGKIVLLNFWATWCPPCKLEMPSMEALHRRLGAEGLMILAINLREDADKVEAFLSEHQFTFTALLDQDGDTFARYGAWSLPTTFIVGKSGRLLGRVTGYRDWESDQAIKIFRKLLNDTPRRTHAPEK
jgi:thiol-disulfide isomerase/thioredoxin